MVAKSNLERYLSSSANHFILDTNIWANRIDDGVFKLGNHTAGLSGEIAKLCGNSAAAAKSNQIANGFSDARAVVSCTRVIFPLHKLVTGQMFWQTTQTGWKKDSTGEYAVRDWTDIAMDILVLAVRLISPVRWLHKMKVYDLGKHASGLTGATMGLWGTILTINLIQATRDLIEQDNIETIHKRSWDAIQAGLDLAALPFDFGLGANHPALAITGSVLNIAAAGGTLIKDAYYYS